MGGCGGKAAKKSKKPYTIPKALEMKCIEFSLISQSHRN